MDSPLLARKSRTVNEASAPPGRAWGLLRLAFFASWAPAIGDTTRISASTPYRSEVFAPPGTTEGRGRDVGIIGLAFFRWLGRESGPGKRWSECQITMIGIPWKESPPAPARDAH